ncbi:MAG TPA: Gfo/Idh/MocA family oxidoreductase [Acetobacteraceae bacterium]|jgi:predicted dehydrogenase|nr:Gfo/Idh/MocA family oxidoreductase [Acetobacteraceae bacterium]
MAAEAARALRFAAIGLDHRHIYEMTGRLLDQGCECAGYWTVGEPQPLEGFVKRYPHIPRVTDQRRLLEDTSVKLVLTAAINCDRAAIAIEAMRHGKDVMSDKPGCTTAEQLADLRRTVAETGRIWSVNYSERFEVRAVTRAIELVNAGAIGRVVQTVGLGPHRLNRPLRPAWFFQRAKYGGVLCDIASHQVEQFLTFTGSADAGIVAASVGNFANLSDAELEDFGEILLRGDGTQGYIRVDWYTPDGLGSWGDGRLTILGTDGYLELRKYIDIDGRPGTDHLFLVDKRQTRYIDCRDADLPYAANLIADVLDRTERAMKQAHCFKVMELAVQAQAMAARLGNLR